MLRQLAGRTHDVLTGVALVRAGEPVAVDVAATRVTFAPMSDAEVAWYVATPSRTTRPAATPSRAWRRVS